MNVFDLYVNHSDQFITDQDLYPDPLSNSAAYKRIRLLNQTADKRTSETISVFVERKHVILAFHDYGACSTLFSIKVTYNVCLDETLSSRLMSLPRTVAPANDSQPVRVKGNCDKDTVQVSGSVYVHCESNGEWNTTALEGSCICKEDMQNNEGICEGMLFILMVKGVTEQYLHLSVLRSNTFYAFPFYDHEYIVKDISQGKMSGNEDIEIGSKNIFGMPLISLSIF